MFARNIGFGLIKSPVCDFGLAGLCGHFGRGVGFGGTMRFKRSAARRYNRFVIRKGFRIRSGLCDKKWMKNRSNIYYLDEMKLKPRWFESLGLWRLMARFRRGAVDPETACLGDGDPRVQQYLDRLRDEGPDAGGGGTRRLPGAAPAGETFLRAAA